jgi:hypothetical protein
MQVTPCREAAGQLACAKTVTECYINITLGDRK